LAGLLSAAAVLGLIGRPLRVLAWPLTIAWRRFRRL
jgi:hypothetical protein